MNPSTKKTSALTHSAASIFFALYGVLFLIFTKYILLSLKGGSILPFFPALIVSLLTGACLGRLFSSELAKNRPWFQVLLIGFLQAVSALLIFSTIIFVYSYFYDPEIAARLTHWQDYFIIYGVIVLSLFLIVGVWLIPLTGLAAVYFNRHFLPGLLAVDKKATPPSHD